MLVCFSIRKQVWGGLAFLTVAAFAQAASADMTGSLMPVSNGTYGQWGTSGGTSHVTLVDETICNGTTDYVKTGTIGQRDSYSINLSSIPDGATLTNISIAPCASRNSKSSGGSSTLNLFYIYNSVKSADVGNYALTGTMPLNLTNTAFSGISLIKSASTKLEIGAVFSAGNRGARLSRIAVVITYLPLLAPTNLTAAVTASSTVMITWADNATTEGGYVVERSASATSTFTQIGLLGPNSAQYEDTFPPMGTVYYRVYAFNGGGNSAYSNTVQIISPAFPGAPVTPGVPPPLQTFSMLQSITSSVAAVQNSIGSPITDYVSVASALDSLGGMLRKIAELVL